MLIIGPATSISDWPLVGLAASRYTRPADAIGGAIADAGDHHAAVAVSDHEHVAEALEREHVDDVGDVRVEVDVGMEQVRALTEAGEGRGVDVVAVVAQTSSNALVAPAAVPTAVHQDERRHRRRG